MPQKRRHKHTQIETNVLKSYASDVICYSGSLENVFTKLLEYLRINLAIGTIGTTLGTRKLFLSLDTVFGEAV